MVTFLGEDGDYVFENIGPDWRGSLVLSSTSSSRSIMLSVNNGINWFSPELDVDIPGCIAVVINASITTALFNGDEGDEVRIM